MDRDLVALLGFVGMFVLMAVRVPIGVAMGIAGVGGFAVLSGIKPGLNLLGSVPLSVVTDYNLSVIPMFILMGAFASRSGMSTELFTAGRAWLGHLRGGLAMAAVAACGGFAAINGSSVATAATMAQVALPEMRSAGFHAGPVRRADRRRRHAGHHDSAVGDLRAVRHHDRDRHHQAVRRRGVAGPDGHRFLLPRGAADRLAAARTPCRAARVHSWNERFVSLRSLWAVLLLFAFVLGGIYGGLFTVEEGAGIGAAGTLVIGILRGRLGPAQIRAALIDTLRVSSAIMMIVIGAFLFGYFLTITQFTQKSVDFLVHLPVGPYGVLALIMVGYFILGAIMDELAMILLTVPIVFPAMMQLGFDPVWFGVIIVMAVTFGMICPPVGINVFVINSIARDITLAKIYRGTMPFIAVDIVRLVILCAFPAISLVAAQLH